MSKRAITWIIASGVLLAVIAASLFYYFPVSHSNHRYCHERRGQPKLPICERVKASH